MTAYLVWMTTMVLELRLGLAGRSFPQLVYSRRLGTDLFCQPCDLNEWFMRNQVTAIASTGFLGSHASSPINKSEADSQTSLLTTTACPISRPPSEIVRQMSKHHHDKSCR
jgi:hypothetical protein